MGQTLNHISILHRVMFQQQFFKTQFIPSTILDLARNPEDVFRAPLNTTKLAPVTKHKSKYIRYFTLSTFILSELIVTLKI